MTREEMWKEFENQLKREVHTPITMSYDDSIRLAELGIKETVTKWKSRLEQVQKAEWVSVSERLPDENEKCLVTQNAFGCKGVRIAYYGTRVSKDHPCWYDYDSEYGYHEVFDIIAWMPLPEPYKEG